MRTTINLPDDLLMQLKHAAISSGSTLTEMIEAAVREKLARRERKGAEAPPVRLKTYGSGGLMPGVDLDDSASLLDVMESDTDPD
jgi:hypothetical protein